MRPRPVRPPPRGLARTMGSLAALDPRARFARAGATASDWEALGRVAQVLVSETTPERVGAVAVEEAQRVLGTSVVAVWELEGDGLRLLAQRGLGATSAAEVARIPLDSPSAAALAARTGRAVEIFDARALGEDLAFVRRVAAREGMRSVLSQPMAARGRVVGVINFVPTERAQPRPFSDRERGIVRAFADLCAAGIEAARRTDAERAARREAEAAVQARDEFLSVAAHELRTPVTSVSGYAQLLLRTLQRGTMDEERLRRWLEQIVDAGGRLAALTQDLLDVSRIRSGHLALRPATVDLVALLQRVGGVFEGRIEDGHRFALDLPAEAVVVEADEERLQQVLENLLENAAKYAPDGGTIALSLDVEGAEARLRVCDEGIGVPPDALERIFEPFGRAPNAAARHIQGMGLGLYICRNIVERHGGRMWAESEGDGRGTTVMSRCQSHELRSCHGTSLALRGGTMDAPQEELTVRLLAHELRTPLTSILGYLQLLQREDRQRDPNLLRDNLALVYAKALDLANVVKRMSDYADPNAALDAGVRAPLGAEGSDVKTLARELGEGLPLRIEVGRGAARAPVDAEALRVVLRELLDNARRFGRPEAEVFVRAALEPTGDGPPRLVVRVTTQGQPIPDEMRERVFAPFALARDHATNPDEGLGLGLTVARRAAEAVGGALELEGSGDATTFVLKLPLSADPIAPRVRVMNERAAQAELQALEVSERLRAAEAHEGDGTLADELIAARERQRKALEDFRTAHRQAVELAGRLDRAYLEVIAAMARAVEARDHYTGSHVERVSRHSVRAAEALGLSGEALRHIEFGSVLHDVGKIGVPDAVLGKPGALTPEEWAAMRRHPEIGRHVLEGIGFLRPALDAVEFHHERWEGGGYPRGLSGEDIPLAGRIVAVADTFDAMTSDRPYRRGLPASVALDEIRRNRGTAFDPEVVDAFVASVEQRAA